MPETKPTIHETIKWARATSPAHGEALADHVYKDQTLDDKKLGNSLSYEDHLSRHKDIGYHILADLNDFTRN
jgi:hypothetical protein